jgi:hypothetical protein
MWSLNLHGALSISLSNTLFSWKPLFLSKYLCVTEILYIIEVHNIWESWLCLILTLDDSIESESLCPEFKTTFPIPAQSFCTASIIENARYHPTQRCEMHVPSSINDICQMVPNVWSKIENSPTSACLNDDRAAQHLNTLCFLDVAKSDPHGTNIQNAHLIE